jgi:hypothetical protein
VAVLVLSPEELDVLVATCKRSAAHLGVPDADVGVLNSTLRKTAAAVAAGAREHPTLVERLAAAVLSKDPGAARAYFDYLTQFPHFIDQGAGGVENDLLAKAVLRLKAQRDLEEAALTASRQMADDLAAALNRLVAGRTFTAYERTITARVVPKAGNPSQLDVALDATQGGGHVLTYKLRNRRIYVGSGFWLKRARTEPLASIDEVLEHAAEELAPYALEAETTGLSHRPQETP